MFNRRSRNSYYANNNYREDRNCMNTDESQYDESCINVSSYENEYDSCACGFDDSYLSVFPDNPSFGESYVPIQYMDKTYRPEVGLKMGTVFPELVSPYEPCDSMKEIEYIQNTNTIGMGCNR